MIKSGKTNTVAQTNKVGTPPADARAAAPASAGFDFIGFQKVLLQKSPKPTGRQWRMEKDAQGQALKPTRKKYSSFMQRFQGGNEAVDFRNAVAPRATDLKAKVQNDAVAQSCDFFTSSKLKDTKEFRRQLAIVACAQEKREAKQALNRANAVLKRELQVLCGGKEKRDKLSTQLCDEVQERQKEMREVRDAALQAKGLPMSKDDKLEHAQAKQWALEIQGSAVLPAPATPVAPVAPTVVPDMASKKKRGALHKLEKTVRQTKLKFQKHADGATEAPKTKPSQKKPAERPPVVLNAQALYEEVLEQASQAGQNPKHFIESKLFETPAAAYMVPEVFEAVVYLYEQLQAQEIKVYLQPFDAEIAAQANTVAALTQARDKAAGVYEALPLPQ